MGFWWSWVVNCCLVTSGRCPIDSPSTCWWVIEMAEYVRLMVRFCKPCSNRSAKKFKKGWTQHERGSNLRSGHKPHHFSRLTDSLCLSLYSIQPWLALKTCLILPYHYAVQRCACSSCHHSSSHLAGCQRKTSYVLHAAHAILLSDVMGRTSVYPGLNAGQTAVSHHPQIALSSYNDHFQSTFVD